MTAASRLKGSPCSVALPAAAAHQRGHVAAELGGVAAPGAAAVEVPVLPAQGRGQDSGQACRMCRGTPTDPYNFDIFNH